MTPEATVRLFTNDQFYLDKVFYANIYRLADLPDKATVIDIGAHVGYFALNAVIRGAKKVYCFEPNRNNFECLLTNTRAIRDAVVPYNFGVLFDEQRVEFEVPKFNESKYFDFGILNIADAQSEKKEVSAVFKLDTVFSDFIQEKEIDLLKISLGGKYEPEVLCASNYINCANAVCGLTQSTTGEIDKLVSHMNSQGFKNSKLIDTGYDGETLFVFSKADSLKLFSI